MASNQTAMDALINEMDRDVEYHERYNTLKTLIDQARERKDIPEYKRLYKEQTGQDIEIYTVPTKDRLQRFPETMTKIKMLNFGLNNMV